MVKRKDFGPAKLPVAQLTILAICRFAEPVALTSVFPYLPEMIESFGVEKKDVAQWAVSLPMAIIARALQGACNGNVGIIRTMVAEMVPEKELQPRAFSIMPLVWSLGSIFGNPRIKRNKTDLGIELGKEIISSSKVLCCQPRPKHHSPSHPAYDESSESLLRPASASESDSITAFEDNYESSKSKPPVSRPSLREVFTRQSVINLIAYTFLALHSVSYDQILPVFMHHPRQIHDRPTHNSPSNSPAVSASIPAESAQSSPSTAS
ncbi:hypothetical protein DID88_000212 [Monilinia fructigena]|uniref:Major facilitator superfamily (MFS) profile domain-containing protein n=1 Tax=Monilinia fructigena TaxID=38457 RepID=A0A395IJG1_9HELO|nr:hypothetical protein DID88_000212 [Monilinia fructigena]